MSRSQQIALVWEKAALHMPQIASAFLLEINTFFDPSSRTKPIEGHRPYSLLLKQIYCTSYFGRWCHDGGPGVEDFMKTLFLYISRLSLADTVSPSLLSSPRFQQLSKTRLLPHPQVNGVQLEEIGTHLEVFVNAILYSPHPIPFDLLPSSSTDPSIVAAKSFLLALIGLIRDMNKANFDTRYAMINGPAKQLRDWIVEGGKRRMEQSFKIEMWGVCSGGCITNCSERNVEKWRS